MDDPRPRVLAFVGDWLLEASVLVGVFPIIDQWLSVGAVRWSVVGGAAGAAMRFFALGVYSKRRR